MEFNKKYHLPKREDDYILLKWNRNFKNVELISEEEKILEINDLQDLIKGITFSHERLGDIKVYFSEFKNELEVEIDGKKSPSNQSHAIKQIEEYRNLFILPIICHFFLFGFILNQLFQTPTTFKSILYFPLGLQFLSLTAYTVITKLLYKKIPLAYLIGFGYYIAYLLWAFITPLVLGGFEGIRILIYFVCFFYILYLIFLASKVKTMWKANQYWTMKRNFNKQEDLLDI